MVHLLCLPALLWIPLASGRHAENPLGQVVGLLTELEAKIKKEGEAEKKAFEEFVEWCDDASRNKEFEIKTASSKKAELQADIGKLTGEAEAADVKIGELASSISADDADMKSATTIREKERSDFAASEAELMDSIDTLSRAINIIERQMRKNPASLAQVDTSNLDNLVRSLTAVVDAASFSTADRQRLVALAQSAQRSDVDDSVDANADDEPSLGAPAATAYKSHGQGIVDVLEDLKEKAEEQLGSLRKAETNAKHNYEMLKQSLEDQMAADNKDMADTKVAKASAEEAKATSESDLAMQVKILRDGNEALETVKGDCMTSAADHEATVAGRKEELKVIAEAKALLQNSTSGAVYQTYSFLQIAGAQQVGSKLHTSADLARAEIVTLVKRLAKEERSPALAQLASRIAAVERYGAEAGEDPFAKVKALITDMIVKLESEAGADATEKAYCDEQLAKTEAKKGELEYDISKLTSKIDKAAATSASLKEDVNRLQAELLALVKSQAEMDKARQEGHSAYAEAKADLMQGLDGVRRALGVLRTYYGNGAASASMLQDSQSLRAMMQQPATPQKHEKASGAGSSIIGILEVVESDFAKNLAAEETEEADMQADYEKLTQENTITKTLKEQDVKYSTQEFKSLDKELAELSSDRDTTDTELSAVLDYYAKIQERCIAKPEKYEERARRRAAEIAGLKEALSILEDEAATALAQHRKKGFHGHFLGARQ